jgi:hypothetical protein
MPVNLLSAGGGTTTLTTESSASNFTLTLPAVTDTLVGLAATQTLTNKSIDATQLTGTIAAARLPAGSVLQVVQTSVTSIVSVATSTFTNLSGFTASITPSSASNRILMFATINMSMVAGTVGQMRFARGGAAIFVGDASGSRTPVTFNQRGSYTGDNDTTHNFAGSFVDSPNTTSAVIYSVQARTNNAGTFYINRGWNNTDNSDAPLAASSIILMEIAA